MNTLASIDAVEEALHNVGSSGADVPVHSFVDLTLSNILGELKQLKRLTDNGAIEVNPEAVKSRVSEARLNEVKQVLGDAVATLEKTRSSFKSKAIGALRQRLETMLEEL